MTDENAVELAKREERAFGRKENLHSLWQELSLNFHSARADYTSESCIGEEYAIDQFDSEPERCRRDLADARASMLRPEDQEWVKVSLRDKKLAERPDVARVLDFISERLRFYLDEPEHGFGRAEKEADNDIVVVGNSIKTPETIVDRNGERRFVVSSWHPRDCAWFDDETRMRQDVMFRRFKASARHIKKLFPRAQLHEDIKKELEKGGNPDREFGLCHTMMPADEYEWYKKPAGRKRVKWASVYYDSDHKMLLSESPSAQFRYVVDRWMTISGSQYGYSPAAMVSLPDGRTQQALVRMLLEAAELSLIPPLKARRDALLSDIDMSGRGITWIDRDYDERLGPSIEPLLPEARQVPIGIDMITRTTLALRDNWYLSKLRLPMQAKTAYETQALLEQFIRENIPLFGPWQAGLSMMLDEILQTLQSPEMRMTAFGDMSEWPPELLEGRDLVWTFKNPLRDAIERNRVNQGQQVLGFAAGVEQVKPGTTAAVWSLEKMARDVTRGTGAPADWLNDETEAAETADANAETADIIGALGMAEQAAGIVKTGSEAAANLQSMQGEAADGSFVYGPQ